MSSIIFNSNLYMYLYLAFLFMLPEIPSLIGNRGGNEGAKQNRLLSNGTKSHVYDLFKTTSACSQATKPVVFLPLWLTRRSLFPNIENDKQQN